jgi:hypothetical protein
VGEVVKTGNEAIKVYDFDESVGTEGVVIDWVKSLTFVSIFWVKSLTFVSIFPLFTTGWVVILLNNFA